jgi:LysM repeat protein
MESDRASRARVLAPLALIAAAIVTVVVIGASLGGSDSDGGSGQRGGASQERSVPQTSDERYYVVQPGDSLTSIAEKTGVPVERLSQLNPNLDPQALISGQRVRLR